jgi:hypothetical protein
VGDLDFALRRVAAAVKNKEARAAAAPTRLVIGTVTSITTGTNTDGTTPLTVRVLGATVRAPYDANYTPVVGHSVYVLLSAGSPLVIGRVIGQPTV